MFSSNFQQDNKYKCQTVSFISITAYLVWIFTVIQKYKFETTFSGTFIDLNNKLSLHLGFVPNWVNADVTCVQCFVRCTNHWYDSVVPDIRSESVQRTRPSLSLLKSQERTLHAIASYSPPRHETREWQPFTVTKLTYSLTPSQGNGSYNSKYLSHDTPMNKHLLNIKITDSYSIVNFLVSGFRGRFWLCKQVRLCYSITFRERKHMYIYSKVKWQAT